MSLSNKIQSRLDELNPRERKLVTWGGATAAIMIGWFVLIDPAMTNLQGSANRIEELSRKTASVQRAALDLNELKGSRSRINVGKEDVLPRLQTLANQEGLGSSVTLKRLEDGLIELQAEQASVAGILQWLAQAEGLSNINIGQINLTKGEAGLVSGSIAVEVQNSGAAGR